MPSVVYRAPSGDRIKEPDPDYIHHLILDPPEGYWKEGSGGATLYYVEDGVTRKLLVLPNDEIGVYLQYIDEEATWLSLEDSTRLREVAECADEWYASIGLFLSRKAAAIAVKEFCETGQRSGAVQWIRPEDIPDEGNW